MIISFPVHTAECNLRSVGAFVVLIGFHTPDSGLNLPPSLARTSASFRVSPPHTIISLPVQIAVCPNLPSGAEFVSIAVHESETGSYLPPSFRAESDVNPPQMIISVPVQTAE